MRTYRLPPASLTMCAVSLLVVACGTDTQGTGQSFDLSAKVDLVGPSDLAMPDLAPSPDLVPPPDLALPPDLAPPPDLLTPPADLSPADAFAFTYYYEFLNDKCPTNPNNPGTKNPGDPCVLGKECKGTCCNCTISTRSYYGAVCLNGRCAMPTEICAITNPIQDVKTQACAP